MENITVNKEFHELHFDSIQLYAVWLLFLWYFSMSVF